jgi:hypothetical protein
MSDICLKTDHLQFFDFRKTARGNPSYCKSSHFSQGQHQRRAGNDSEHFLQTIPRLHPSPFRL